jgi:signal transduction histidine kinase/PAS domain-containing protein
MHAVGRCAEFGRGHDILPVAANHLLSGVVRTRSGLWLATPRELARHYPEVTPDPTLTAWVALPLVLAGIALGSIGWSFTRPLTTRQREYLQELARVGAEGLYRAALYDSEHSARRDVDAARERLSDTLDSLPEAVFTLDDRGRCTDANVAAERLVVLPREALFGTTVWEYLPGDSSSTREAFTRAVLDQATTTLHTMHGEMCLAIRVTPCRDGAVVSVSDTAEAARPAVPVLAEISAALDSTYEPAAAAAEVARLSVPALGDWCVVELVDDQGWLQRVASAHVDPTREQALQELERTHASARRRVPRGLRDGRPVLVPVAADGAARAAGMSVRMLRSLLQLGLGSLLVIPLHIHGRTLGVLTYGAADANRCLDQPDLAVAEELGRRCAVAVEYAKLSRIVQDSLQVREEFVAATSHELRTPLSHIKGFVSTLRTTETEWDPETRDDFLAEIEREADRLAKLVENLLDMSRIESSGLDPTALAPTSARSLIEGGVDRMRGSLGNHPLQIKLPDDLPSVMVDESQIERVIANLLENAAKYSPPDELIEVTGLVDGTAINLRIEDRGLGVPPEHVERIFEPFFREPASSGYPVKPGSGLGLAICRSIIRAHDGQIWAEQRPGGGAALVFSLPVATNGQKV